MPFNATFGWNPDWHLVVRWQYMVILVSHQLVEVGPIFALRFRSYELDEGKRWSG